MTLRVRLKKQNGSCSLLEVKMGVIIQVGHRSTQASQLIDLFYAGTLAVPNKSKSYNLSAQEISQTVAKMSHKRLTQTKKRMIDGLVTDLLLSNMGHQYWGWYSEDNIYHLNFWKKYIDDVIFVLVFDSPKRLFEQISVENKPNKNTFDAMIASWLAYNRHILKFFKENASHCILIEGSQALNGVDKLSKFVMPKEVDGDEATQFGEGDTSTELAISAEKMAVSTEVSYSQDWVNIFQAKEGSQTPEVIYQEYVDRCLLAELGSLYPEVVELYRTLQSNSLSQSGRDMQLDFDDLLDLFIVGNQVASGGVFASEKLKVALMDEQEKTTLLKNDCQKLSLERQQLQSQLDAQKSLINNLQSKMDKSNSDNVLQELHRTQEYLEELFLENKSLALQLGRLRGVREASAKDMEKETIGSPAYSPILIGADKRVKSELPYRLGHILVSHAGSPKKIFRIPVDVLKEYQEFQKSAAELEKLPEISEYQDADKAEKVKQHLSYRLGNVLVENVKSPKKSLILPLLLTKEVINFKIKKK